MSDSMSVRQFLRLRMGVIDSVYLEHEAGERNGRLYCRCGYQGQEPEWLLHVADKIADAIQGPLEVELPLDDVAPVLDFALDAVDEDRYRWGEKVPS